MNGAKSCAASFKTEPIMASSGDGPEIKLRATRSGVGIGGRGRGFGAYVGDDMLPVMAAVKVATVQISLLTNPAMPPLDCPTSSDVGTSCTWRTGLLRFHSGRMAGGRTSSG